MIVERINDSKARRIKQYPVKSNRASDLGHPCLRYHVLNRTRWQDRSLHDVGLQYIFDMGSEIEKIVIREMQDAGIDVIEQQRAFSWDGYNITGHIDGRVLADGKAYPFEIKSMSPYVFDAVNSIDDMKRGKYLYLRKYPVQLNLYLLMSETDRGVFILKNKVNGRLKEIWMDVDYEMGEETLQRAEAINAHVAAGTVPDPCEYDEQVCGNCPFAHICIRERVGKEIEIENNDELAELIAKMLELEEAHKEHELLNKQISKLVEGRYKLVCGDYYIDGKWCERKGFTVEPSRYWKKSIVKL